ncbi:response regulator transcription factor [Solirubrobacter ginsenosidimutans]|uniref:Response regulator transcription factor n=1 Tax=Solirubrobacter ginsenosidimutans TaxID=490573 RepID=A0A9X3MRI7_9ACTN|nr:response regulator transcription factor [Solirubrobacter ginsenosidimutans]MDA0159860.1 response regulator transcription factor [Solirubrobacter ginsenosidimutans]
MGCSVLVVDDDASFRRIAIRIVESWGHNVVGEAGGVGEAMLRAHEVRPDTVIVDIGLPDGDGFDLTRRLLALEWPIRVLVMSSDSDIANVAVAESAGASGFFPKLELLGAGFRQAIEDR